MINQQPTDKTQGDLSQGSADSRNRAENPKKTSKTHHQGGKAKGTRTEARPGSNPKNPGDFGHH
jgi:hypothetical protein